MKREKKTKIKLQNRTQKNLKEVGDEKTELMKRKRKHHEKNKNESKTKERKTEHQFS